MIYLSAFLIAEIFIRLINLIQSNSDWDACIHGWTSVCVCLCTITLITGWVFDAILTLIFCDNIDLTVHLELVVFSIRHTCVVFTPWFLIPVMPYDLGFRELLFPFPVLQWKPHEHLYKNKMASLTERALTMTKIFYGYSADNLVIQGQRWILLIPSLSFWSHGRFPSWTIFWKRIKCPCLS